MEVLRWIRERGCWDLGWKKDEDKLLETEEKTAYKPVSRKGEEKSDQSWDKSRV